VTRRRLLALETMTVSFAVRDLDDQVLTVGQSVEDNRARDRRR
jgi:hypothetical protein